MDKDKTKGTEGSMTGIKEAVAAAQVIKVGVEIIERTVPKGLAVIRSWWISKYVLIIGQSRAGKSTFVDYFRFGIFGDETKTEETTDETPTARFAISLGRDKSLELSVSKALETPGHWGPQKHADLAFQKNPDAIVLLLDLKRPLSGTDEASKDQDIETWVTRFCERYELRLLKNSSKTRRLQAFIVVLNKSDKVDKDTKERSIHRVRQIMNTGLREIRRSMTHPIEVMSGVMVTNPNGTKEADAIIAKLARRFCK